MFLNKNENMDAHIKYWKYIAHGFKKLYIYAILKL